MLLYVLLYLLSFTEFILLKMHFFIYIDKSGYVYCLGGFALNMLQKRGLSNVIQRCKSLTV